jgi:hypothetical protein
MNYIYVYLIFSKTGTWLSRALNIFSDTKYVHASISFDDSFSKMYSFGRTNPSNPFSGGFVEENLFDGVSPIPFSKDILDEGIELLHGNECEFVQKVWHQRLMILQRDQEIY